MRKIVVEVHNDSVFVCILGENGDNIKQFPGRKSNGNSAPLSV